MAEQSSYRCAVYTRKSHEDGLDQEFNSLDAQSEACKAYIASQAGLGWRLRDQTYDDGGISGGHMDRPGLQELISDIKAGLVDIIVVYKVDRLTRSLTDFAKLVDVFDEHDVSFVSVTQAFNTTTSMGRLTLNVLLSFAQFEREVTAERIRDKIAASKKKGMWMGGTVPFGYRNEDRKLHIVEEEGNTVRALYQLYIQHKNVRVVKVAADKLSFTSRLRTHKSGKQTGGKLFSRGHIYRILTNPIYIGRIQHKDKIYDGDHDPIIDRAVWNDVQSILKDNANKRKMIGNSKSPALLAGLLVDENYTKLVPHHANKKGTRYHYYVSQQLKTSDQDTGWRIPMKTIERLVVDTLVETVTSRSRILALLPITNLSANAIQNIAKQAKDFGLELQDGDHQFLKTIYNELLKSIRLTTNDAQILFNTPDLTKLLNIELQNDAELKIIKPMTIRRRGQEMKMVIGGQTSNTSNRDDALIKLIAKAHLLKTELESGVVNSIKDFATKHGLDHGDAKNLVPLCYLAPDVIGDILNGHQPVDMMASRLKHMASLPIVWADQRQYLGCA